VDDLIEFGISSSGKERIKLGYYIFTLMSDCKYELDDLVALKPLLAILPPLIRSIPMIILWLIYIKLLNNIESSL